MKTLRQTCAVTILSLTLAVSVLAGHMDTTGAPAPAPSASSELNADGIVVNNAGGGQMNNTITISIVQTILSVIYR